MSNQVSIIKKKLNQINKIIEQTYPQEKDIGILGGTSGLAVYCFYFSRVAECNRSSELGKEILDDCLKVISSGYDYPTYATGIAGAAFAFDHLQQESFIELENDFFDDIDLFLYHAMCFSFNQGNFDFLHGALGYGFYFFKRYQNCKSPNLQQKYKKYLLELLGRLRESSCAKGEMIYWHSSLDISKGIDLGLSHGMSSIINFLSRVSTIKELKVEAEDLLVRSVSFMLDQISEVTDQISIFPNYTWEQPNQKNQEQNESAVSWCYGDLGIGLSLWHASEQLNHKVIKDSAQNILIQTSLRTSPETSLVADAGLCHGSYGNAQIFNYLYRQTGYPEYRLAANKWIEDGLAKSTFSDGYAGYKQRVGLDRWERKLGLLEGISGIGLALLSHISTDANQWDECLMINS